MVTRSEDVLIFVNVNPQLTSINSIYKGLEIFFHNSKIIGPSMPKLVIKNGVIERRNIKSWI